MSFIDELAKRGWVVDYYTVSKSFEGVIVTLNKTNNTVTYNYAKISNIEELGGAVIQQLDSVKQLIAGDVEYYSKKLDKVSKALDVAKEEFRSKTLGEILIEKGWVFDNKEYSNCGVIIKLSYEGKYYLGGEEVVTYEDVVAAVVSNINDSIEYHARCVDKLKNNIEKITGEKYVVD